MKQREFEHLGITKVKDQWGLISFNPNKAFTTAPKIVKEYHDADNVRMYKCEGDRNFIADTYDKQFLPQHNLKMRKRAMKGDNSFYKL